MRNPAPVFGIIVALIVVLIFLGRETMRDVVIGEPPASVVSLESVPTVVDSGRHILTRASVGEFVIYTINHDGCLWVIVERNVSIAIVHHPKCGNHSTNFR